jgi:hypothetical protein
MAFAGAAVNPITAQDISTIDAWWGDGSEAKITHWHDDADGYIRTWILPGVPKGHTIKHGVHKSTGHYYLTISGPSINKSWT